VRQLIEVDDSSFGPEVIFFEIGAKREKFVVHKALLLEKIPTFSQYLTQGADENVSVFELVSYDDLAPLEHPSLQASF